MYHVYLDERKNRDEFAIRAAKHFAKNPSHWTYTDGEIEGGAMLAMKFGLSNDCVVVFKIADEEVTNYMELIKQAEDL